MRQILTVRLLSSVLPKRFVNARVLHLSDVGKKYCARQFCRAESDLTSLCSEICFQPREFKWDWSVLLIFGCLRLSCAVLVPSVICWNLLFVYSFLHPVVLSFPFKKLWRVKSLRYWNPQRWLSLEKQKKKIGEIQ